jgi:hypothetical protein
MKNSITLNGKRYSCRIYDSQQYADRYTVCFRAVKVADKLWYPYLAMGATPFHPQGFCQHGDSPYKIDGKHLGKRISFDDLPLDCKKIIEQELT